MKAKTTTQSMTVAAFGLVCASGAFAQLPVERVLPLDMAVTAASAAVRSCEAKGYAVSATVVDRAGRIRAQLRADGASPHTLETSRKKAFTAVALKQPTSVYARMVAGDRSLDTLRDMSTELLLLGGGLPLKVENDIVAGIGVGGAPGAQFDEACAAAGAEAISAGLR